MSRHEYSEELDNWDRIRWRGMVASATRGKRGQALFRDMLAALDAMPEKRLIVRELQDSDGEVCALGAVGQRRGMKLDELDPEEPESVAAAFNIAECLAREVAFVNDECGNIQFVADGMTEYGTTKWKRIEETPEERWTRVREWVVKQIKEFEA